MSIRLDEIRNLVRKYRTEQTMRQIVIDSIFGNEIINEKKRVVKKLKSKCWLVSKNVA
jgi:hypothetical protein